MYAAAGEVVDVDLLETFDHYVAEAVEGMERTDHALGAVGDVGVFGLGGAQVLAVEAVILHHFEVGELDRGALGRAAAEFEPAGDLLAQVDDLLVLGGDDEFDGLDALGDAQRHGQTVLHALGAHVLDHDRLQLGAVGVGIVDLAVVDAGEAYGALGGVPGLVGADDLLGVVLVGHVDLGQQGDVVGIQALEAGAVAAQTEAGDGPAATHHEFDGVFAGFQLLGHVESSGLEPGVVVVAVGGQIFVADLFTVDVELVYAQRGGVCAGGFDGLVNGDGLYEIHVLADVGGDPLSGPGFVHLAGLEPALALGGIAVVGPDGDLPVVAGAGLQLQLGNEAQAVDIVALAGVVDGLGQAGAGADNDLRGGLLLSGGLVNLPGKAQRLELEAHGLDDAVRHHFKNAHMDIPPRKVL